MAFASSKPLLLLPISCLGNSPLLTEGQLHPQTMELDRGEGIMGPKSLPDQKAGIPTKDEVGIQGHSPFTSPRDATEFVSKGTKAVSAEPRAHR